MTDTLEKPRISKTERAERLARAVTWSPPTSRARLTFDRPKSTAISSISSFIQTERESRQNIWRAEQLDENTLNRMTADEMMALMVDISPEMSRADWDWLRLFLAGWEYHVYRPGGKKVHKPGEAAVAMMIASMDALHGTFEDVLTRIVQGGLIRGAFFAEAVFDSDARTLIDIATPDPALVVFQPKTDPVRGDIWEKGMMDGEDFVSIESEFVRYIPIDPFPGKPYGRSPLMPGLGPSLFLLSLMSDMKRVIRQQGYPRIDIEVDVEEMNEIIDNGEWEDEDELSNALVAAVEAAVAQVEQQYMDVPPDGAYVHSSVIKINGLVGAIDAGFLQAVDALINALERQDTRGMKMMPLLMGISDTADESDANRQWELQVKGVKALQHKVEQMLGDLFSLGLQAQGIQAVVEWRFAELRVAEAMRDTQVDQLKAAVAAKMEAYGYWEADEAAIYATDHPIPESLKEERIPLLNMGFMDQDAYGQVGLDDPSPQDPSNAEPEPSENK